ncbi:MAG: MATE family efflux transporter [Subdoligranulum sp.]|jgi:Na+-driven multidrug efflux pump
MSDFMRILCKIAIPVTLQGMLQASFSIVDQIMIGQLGEAGIAAVGLCSNFTLIFSVMSGAVGTVAGILIAQFLGAEEHTEAWRSLDVSLVCGGVLAALFLLTAGGFPAQVLGLYTADDAILRRGTSASWRSLICPWRSAPSCPHGCAARNTPLSPFGQVLAR